MDSSLVFLSLMCIPFSVMVRCFNFKEFGYVLHVGACECIGMFSCVCMCVSVYVLICVYVFFFMCVCMCEFVCMFVLLNMCASVFCLCFCVCETGVCILYYCILVC